MSESESKPSPIQGPAAHQRERDNRTLPAKAVFYDTENPRKITLPSIESFRKNAEEQIPTATPVEGPAAHQRERDNRTLPAKDYTRLNLPLRTSNS